VVLFAQLAEPISQILSSQASRRRVVQVERPTSEGESFDAVEFVFDTMARGRRTKAGVIMLEAYWANPQHRPGLIKTIAWLAKSLPLLAILLLAPGQRDFDLSRGILLALSTATFFQYCSSCALLSEVHGGGPLSPPLHLLL
jgi:hypothetical protein